MNPDDREAINRFFDEAYPTLVAALSYHTGDRHLAEEVAQEALVRACDRWHKVRQLDSPIGWTFRVAVNIANSHFRRRGAERRAHQRHGAGPHAHEDTDTSDRLAIRSALQQLTKQQREAVVLRYFLGMDSAEAGRTLGTSAVAVRGLTHRAILALRDMLDIDVDCELKEVATDAS